jgi:hypothetical protein
VKQAKKKVVGFHDNWLFFNSLPDHTKSFYNSLLDDDKISFISHIIEHDYDNSSAGIIKAGAIFNIHNKLKQKESKPAKTYDYSWQALKKLKAGIDNKIARDNITHVFIYSPGWDREQQESLKNYNRLLGYLSDTAAEMSGRNVFNPLIIGVYCSSDYKMPIFSYLNKADDADKISMLWVNILLNKIILPLKKNKNIKVVLLGDGLGSRMITTAAFSSSLISKKKSPVKIKADLVIGLDGRFSIDRFITGKGFEPPLYASYQDVAHKFVYTWSEHCDEEKVASFITGEIHIGGEHAYEVAQTYPDIFGLAALKLGSMGVAEEHVRSDKVIIINASKIIKFETYSNERQSYSDLFRPEIARLIWVFIQGLTDFEEGDL